jgi:hypothetical protein
LESICTVYNQQEESKNTFYGLNGVMACNVYGESPLFYSPSFYYQAIFSESDVKIMRSFYPEQEKDSVQKIEDKFSHVKSEICYLAQEEKKELKNLEEINAVIESTKPIVGQVKFVQEEFEIELLFPVKHINTSVTKQQFQVETGSVLMLDLEKEMDGSIKNLTQAFISFNNYTAVDFLLYDVDGSDINRSIRRYCKPLHMSAEVKLWTY